MAIAAAREAGIRLAATTYPGTTDHREGAGGDQRATDESMRQLVASMEEDRRRIARDLHDVVGQALTAVRLSIDGLRSDPSRRTDLELRRSLAVIDQAMRDVRDVAIDLRPSILDDLGLVAAARWYVHRQGRIAGFRTSFAADAGALHLDDAAESACFRALQEALTNVARHAQATRVRVSIRRSRDVVLLTVEDDGVGFDVRRPRGRGRRPSIGLTGMAERVALAGGSLEIASTPGNGTALRAVFPRATADGVGIAG